MQPGVLTALASATIVAPDESASSPALEATVRLACAGAWRAVEVVLAGDVLRGRLGKTRDTYVRDGVEAVLGLFGSVAVRPEPLAELRAARDAGVLEGALDLERIAARVRTEGAGSVGKTAVERVRRELAGYPQLDAALADHELGALLVDAARALFRGLARDRELARWAIGPTGAPARDRALVAFAELIGSPASIDELEALIALPIHLDENVQFTVYRPRSIDPGRWHAMLAFAHLADRRVGDDDAPDPVEEVQRQAASVLGELARAYQPVTQDAGTAIPADGELVFVPEIAGIEFNPPRRAFLWLEAVHREEFRLRAGRELVGRTARGRLTVFLGHIAIAEVPLSVRVDDRRAEPAVREPVHARTYRKIFASYSHRDVAIVNQFETYARALGDEYLRDWIHLRTGEVWNDRLRQLIEQADAFQLFWSRNSMHSKFVRQEYEHALALDRPSFVRPTYWEDPMPTAPGLPPDALLRLHFQKIGGPAIAQAEAAPAVDAHPRAPRPGGSMPRPAESSPAQAPPRPAESSPPAMPAPMARPAPSPPPARSVAASAPPPLAAIPVLAIPDPRRDTARQAAIAVDAEALDAATTAPALPQMDHERAATSTTSLHDPVTEELDSTSPHAARKAELATAPAVVRRPLGVERLGGSDDEDDPVIEPPAPARPARVEEAGRAERAKRRAPMAGASSRRPPATSPPPEARAVAAAAPPGSRAVQAGPREASSAPPARVAARRDPGDASSEPPAYQRRPVPGYSAPAEDHEPPAPGYRAPARGRDDTEPAPKDAAPESVSDASVTLDRLAKADDSMPTLPGFADADADRDDRPAAGPRAVPPRSATPSVSSSDPPPRHAAVDARAATAPEPRAATAPDARAATTPDARAATERPSELPKIPATMPNKAPPPPRPSEPLATSARASSQPPVPGPGQRVICDRCGTENSGGGRFCASCGTVLPTPSVPPMRPSPAPSANFAQPARTNAAADDRAVSPYAPTVPQPQYQGPGDPYAAVGGEPARSGTRWLIVALVVIAVVVAVVVYLMLR